MMAGQPCAIPLSKGFVTIVDAFLFDYLSQWKWCVAECRPGKFYAVRSVSTGLKTPRQRRIYLHRLIADLVGMDTTALIDHRDRNTLNNVVYNLRPASQQQNQANRDKDTDNTSGFKGVVWFRETRKWGAAIKIEGKRRHLGLFDSPVEAAKAYDKAARDAFGEFALTNFRDAA